MIFFVVKTVPLTSSWHCSWPNSRVEVHLYDHVHPWLLRYSHGNGSNCDRPRDSRTGPDNPVCFCALPLTHAALPQIYTYIAPRRQELPQWILGESDSQNTFERGQGCRVYDHTLGVFVPTLWCLHIYAAIHDLGTRFFQILSNLGIEVLNVEPWGCTRM